MSALVQQLLLSQGARYTSRLGEADWKQVPVLLELPAGGALPAGSWLVLPWDVREPHLLEAWLGRLRGHLGALPRHVAIVTSLGHVGEGWLSALGLRLGTRIAAVQVATGSIAGPEDLAAPLDVLFEEDTPELLATVNPLQHLSALADPRDPAVFIERLRRATPRAAVTRGLIGLNALVFAVMLVATGFDLFGGFRTRELITWGANVQAFTVGQGEWWRMLSCTFLHADLMHIGMNMWALKVLGDMAERLFGNLTFAFIYVAAGLGGSVASLAFTLSRDPLLPSVGASGAVFGIMGALLGYALSRRGSVPPALYKSLTRNAIFFIGLNVVIGLSIAAIDNAAHIGGLVTGIAGGLLLSRDLPPAPQPSPQRRLAAGAALLAAVAGAFVLTLP